MQIPGLTPLVTHWPSPEHFTHVFDGRSQIGFVGSALQSTLVALVHSTHDPFGPHVGFVLSRAAHTVPSPIRETSHGRHDPRSQMGFPDGQSPLVTHSGMTSA